MWLTERYTFSRGRAVVPASFLRIRLWILSRVAFFELLISILVVLRSGPCPGLRGPQLLPLMGPSAGDRSVPANSFARVVRTPAGFSSGRHLAPAAGAARRQRPEGHRLARTRR